MDVHVLIREDQNDHGFIDTSIEGVFLTRHGALVAMREAQEEARSEGLRATTMDDDSCEDDWQVYWKIE